MFTESRARTGNIIPDCVNWAGGCEGINTGTTQTDGNVPAPTSDLLSSWEWSPSQVNQDSELPSTTDGLGLSTQIVESGPQPSFTSIQSQTPTIRTAITTSRTQSTAPSQSTSIITQDPNSATPTVGIVAAISDGNETKGLNAGAVTGVAIGTFIIGAALAFVAAFFLFKQRNKHNNGNVSTKDYPSFADSAPDLGMMQKGVGGLGGRHSPYVQVSQTPMPASPAPALSPPMIAPTAMANESSKDVTSFLPPAADDDEVWTGVSHLFSMMHEHVEKFYRDVHACITPSMEHGIAKFGVKGVDMAELLQECSSPTAALKHALVAYVLGITGPKQEGDKEETLFPEELAHIANGTGGGSDPDFIAATSLHRRVSVYLYSTVTGYPNRRKSWMTHSNTREAAEHFSLTFFPWANPMSSDQDRDDDLARIITDTLTVRVWLFGQLDTYEFEWEGVGERGVVVNPGLVKRRWRGGDGDGDGGGGVVHVVEGAVVAM